MFAGRVAHDLLLVCYYRYGIGWGLRDDGDYPADVTVGAVGANSVTVVSGNVLSGIDVHGLGARVVNTRVGVALDGLAPVPNQIKGIYVASDAHNCTIGAPGAGSLNIVGGNVNVGVSIHGSSVRVLNTFVGVGVDGYAARAVQFHPNGGQFDFARPPARTPHVGPQYV